MTRSKSAALVAALLFGLAGTGSALAEDSYRWGDAGGWDILVDTTIGNGCFIYSEFRDGTAVRLGFNPNAGNSYIMVGNHDWDRIEQDGSYDITIKMGRSAPWHATATGVIMNHLPLLMASTDDVNFVRDFAKKSSIEVIYKGDSIAKLSLAGTFAAVTEMLRCQTSVEANGGSNRSDGGIQSDAKD